MHLQCKPRFLRNACTCDTHLHQKRLRKGSVKFTFNETVGHKQATLPKMNSSKDVFKQHNNNCHEYVNRKKD